MDMPRVVQEYFAADSRNDADALLNTFSAEAVVEDEHTRHRGYVAIRKWWMAAKEASHFVAEPLESAVDGDNVSVRARVTGQFPGSPVTLTHTFTVEGEKIVRLEIK